MDKKRPSEQRQEGLGPELDELLASVPPPKAPAWFAAKTLARLRQNRAQEEKTVSAWRRWRWVWASGAAVVVGSWILWNQPEPSVQISDAMVFAALDALVEQEEENRWWLGL